jgi:MtN3 and saliva related transmembrane protein
VVTLIGSLAGLLTTACWLPQARKTLRLGTADDFAWPYLAMLTVGLATWIGYGFLLHSPPVYICNIVTLGLVLMVGTVKVQAHHRRLTREAAVTLMVESIEA